MTELEALKILIADINLTAWAKGAQKTLANHHERLTALEEAAHAHHEDRPIPYRLTELPDELRAAAEALCDAVRVHHRDTGDGDAIGEAAGRLRRALDAELFTAPPEGELGRRIAEAFRAWRGLPDHLPSAELQRALEELEELHLPLETDDIPPAEHNPIPFSVLPTDGMSYKQYLDFTTPHLFDVPTFEVIFRGEAVNEEDAT